MKIYRLFIVILILLTFMVLPAFAENDGWGGPKLRVFRGKTVAPAVTDDVTKGYRIGDKWVDETAKKEYSLLDKTADAADWDLINQDGSGVSNVAYSATWDGDQAHSPSMDAVYDEMETKQDTVTEGSLPNLITTGDVKDEELVNADISPTAAIDIDKTGWIEAGVTNIVSGETNAVEWHPSPGKFQKYRLTGTFSDPVVLLVSETDQLGDNFSDGSVLILENVGTLQIQIGDISGQHEISGVTYYGDQGNTLCLIYSTNQWVEFARSSDTISADILNVKQKTFSFGGLTGAYQYSSISGATVTMTEAEACGYGIHESSTSGYYKLPDPDPGSNNVGMLGQLMIGVAGQDITVTDISGASPFVDGTATIAKTGAVITTSTAGEYFTWEQIWVAEYGWRWAIRVQDD